MNRKSILLLFSLVVLLIFSGCGLLNRKRELLDLLQYQICAPPCWQGITPGTTTFNEASLIAESLVSTDKITSNRSPFSINKIGLPKFFTLSYKTAAVGIEQNTQGIVEEISITFRYNRDDPKLEDLIEIYGNPISIDICHDLMEIHRAVVLLQYPEVSLHYSEKLPTEGDSFTVHVNKDTRIDFISYKSPETAFPILDFSFPWSGYGDFTITPAEKNPLSTCP